MGGKKYIFLLIFTFTVSLTIVSCSNNDSSEVADSNIVFSESDNNKEELKMYDTTPISNAYLSGNSEGLEQFDKDILDKASQIISEIISSEMSDFDKELAVHDYLILNCTYDEKALAAIPAYTENSDNPYGTLYTGQAICKGYTTTFQMFMDMLVIPCKTIYANDNSGDEHAWNIVCLENEWYYVDTTWDDPVPDSDGRAVCHKYFNKTQIEMEEGHVWDTLNLPKADSIRYSYANQMCVNVSDYDDIQQAVQDVINKNNQEAYMIFDESIDVYFDEIDGLEDYFVPSRKSQLYKYTSALEKHFRDYSLYYRRVQTERGICLEIKIK